MSEIIGHRFGFLTVVKAMSDDDYLCRCNKCGKEIIVNKNDLLSCKVLFCKDCAPAQNRVRKLIIQTYGSFTDYDYASDGIEVCHVCGLPKIYENVKPRKLCRSCYVRINRNNGSPDFVVKDKIKREKLNQLAERERRFNERVENFKPSRSNKNVDEIRRLYAVEGKTYQEIGDILGISRQRVYQIMHKEYKRNRG